MNIRLLPPPGTPIGYRRDGRPIYPVIGAAKDEEEFEAETDDEEEEDEPEEDQDDEPEEKDGGKKWQPPSKAEVVRMQYALSKANASAKERRLALAEKDKLIAELQKKEADREAEAERKALLADQLPAGGAVKGKKGRGGVPAPAPTLPDSVLTKAQVRQLTAQAAKEAEERTAAKFQSKVVSQAARAALKDAGAAGNVSRLVALLNLDEVQVDDEGEVSEELEQQIQQLKEELPQLFAPAEPPKPVRKRAPAPKVTPAGRQEEEQRPQSSAERIAAMALGSRM
jgi:hypothetical protein